MLQHPPVLPGSHLIHARACQDTANGYFQALASRSRTQLCWTALVLMLSLSKSQLILLRATWQKRVQSRVFFFQNLEPEAEKGEKRKYSGFQNTYTKWKKMGWVVTVPPKCFEIHSITHGFALEIHIYTPHGI